MVQSQNPVLATLVLHFSRAQAYVPLGGTACSGTTPARHKNKNMKSMVGISPKLKFVPTSAYINEEEVVL